MRLGQETASIARENGVIPSKYRAISCALPLAKDIARFRSGEAVYVPEDTKMGKKHFLKLIFHNKGIEMVNLQLYILRRLGQPYQIS